MMQRSSGHWQSLESCSMPKLWPISCATVVATRPTASLWSMLTPPENSNVQIGPLSALPTTPPSNCVLLSMQDKLLSTRGKTARCAAVFGCLLHAICRRFALCKHFAVRWVIYVHKSGIGTPAEQLLSESLQTLLVLPQRSHQ